MNQCTVLQEADRTVEDSLHAVCKLSEFLNHTFMRQQQANFFDEKKIIWP
jgi:hypothetical protein